MRHIATVRVETLSQCGCAPPPLATHSHTCLLHVLFCAPWATASRNHQLRRHIALNQATTGTKDRTIGLPARGTNAREQMVRGNLQAFPLPPRTKHTAATRAPPWLLYACSVPSSTSSLSPPAHLSVSADTSHRWTLPMAKRWPGYGQAMARLWNGNTCAEVAASVARAPTVGAGEVRTFSALL